MDFNLLFIFIYKIEVKLNLIGPMLFILQTEKSGKIFKYVHCTALHKYSITDKSGLWWFRGVV